MYTNGAYPMVCVDPSCRQPVVGEVYEVYPDTLAPIDYMEKGAGYTRELIELAVPTLDTWVGGSAYIYLQTVAKVGGKTIVASNSWRTYLAETARGASFSRQAVRAWMSRNVSEAIEGASAEVNLTKLCELAAEAFGEDLEGGPLDDPDHWIWEVAVEVKDSFDSASS